jgi:glycosyltransferase involved in cell wall biosynthesis
MRICFISLEIFAFGKYGGFGRATRIIGRELCKLGHEVYAVVPRRGEQKKYEVLDGIKVLGFEINNPFKARELLIEADAQIYHSEEPSFLTYLAQQIMPDRRHVITFRDTRTLKDWVIEFNQPSKSKLQVLRNILFEDSIFTQMSVNRADALGSAAQFLIEKAQRKYKLTNPPIFLPTPVQVPSEIIKSSDPAVVFVSRLDRRKRPDKFYELALHFPEVNFSVVGKGQDKKFITELNHQYKDIPNLKQYDFIDQFNDTRFSEILSSAWVLVNTSLREGLPNSFLEAAAHQCAILSIVNPDGFATKYGYHVDNDDFREGLEKLLHNNLWREKGMEGQNYIKQTYSSPAAMAIHLEVYHKLLMEEDGVGK